MQSKTRKRFKLKKQQTSKMKTSKMKTSKMKTSKMKTRKMNAGNEKSCPNSVLPCYWMDSNYAEPTKQNTTWHTCITVNGIKHRIIYITSQNVLIKSIESLQIPVFNVKLLPDNDPVNCNIMIEDKFVSCFLNVCGEWYAIMRLFGKTLNTGIFARTEANKVYYKIKNIDIDAQAKTINEMIPGRVVGNGLITISDKYFTNITSSFKLMTSNSRVISLNSGCFDNINKTHSVFKVLQRFRQQKLFANIGKHEVIHQLLDND
jgi:hypothetical protein